jgi:lauroyl/myristoyl acyltransferase
MLENRLKKAAPVKHARLSLVKVLRFKLELLGCKLLVHVFAHLSYRSVCTISHLVGTLAARVSSLVDDFARQNVDLALPETSPSDRSRVVAMSYVNFAQTMLSLFWSATKSEAEIARVTSLSGFEEVNERAKRDGKPLILTTFHFGNWELSSLGVAIRGRPVLIVGEDFKNPLLRPFFHQLRSRFGSEVIPQAGAAVRLLRHLKGGGDVAFLFDLTMPPAPKGAVVSAFGSPRLEMSVTPLHALLAKRTGAIWVPVISTPDGRKGVHIKAMPPMDIPNDISINETVQRGWDLLERTVKSRPDLYLWAYRHFRYRPSDANRAYPKYARPSPALDALKLELRTGVTPDHS